ncbi:GumC domain-containing protein [Pyrobaculum calidifontis]|uniref:Uncharacterized protein n=1 Tax=Pyrobaculum calidifontis (strain DSM 21063 / JCM 11548 / VA1) TaxID=410359 RepID=A3MVU2_PYRCJ|nr:tropomyosin [Pyrobaculum calidifontis]ABO08759.1 hypothetical protein Pcal_1337 [Pyrobaculum calidifontis JCM 11548]
MDVVYYLVGLSVTIIGMLGGAMFWLGRKFAQIDERLQRLEKGYEELRSTLTEFKNWTEKKFAEVEGELAGVKERVAAVEKGLEEVKGRLVNVESRLMGVEKELEEVKGRLANVEGRVAGLEGRLAEVEKGLADVRSRLANVESRLVGVEKGLEEVKSRLAVVEGRVVEVEKGLTDVRNRLAGVEGRVAEVERGLADVRSRLAGVEGRLVEFEERFVSFADSVRGSVVSMNSLVVEFLGLKGLLSREEVGFLSREASRLALAIRPNPITEEEVEFLRRVFSKPVEEMTVEELEKAAEIAKRWWYREGKEEAYRLFLIAWTIRTYKLIQEPREKKEG